MLYVNFVKWQEKSGVDLVAHEKFSEPREVEVMLYANIIAVVL